MLDHRIDEYRARGKAHGEALASDALAKCMNKPSDVAQAWWRENIGDGTPAKQVELVAAGATAEEIDAFFAASQEAFSRMYTLADDINAARVDDVIDRAIAPMRPKRRDN